MCRNCCCDIKNTLITYRELNSHNSICKSLYANYALTSSPPPPSPSVSFLSSRPLLRVFPQYTESLEQARWTTVRRSERLFTLPPLCFFGLKNDFFSGKSAVPKVQQKVIVTDILRFFLQMCIQVFIWQKIHSILNACNF